MGRKKKGIICTSTNCQYVAHTQSTWYLAMHAYMYNVFPCRVNVQLYKEEIGELRDKLNKEKKTRYHTHLVEKLTG